MTLDLASVDASAVQTSLTSWLLAQVSDLIGVEQDEIDVHVPLQDYGVDSRQFVDIALDLEGVLGRKVPLTLLWDSPSIASIAAVLSRPAAP